MSDEDLSADEVEAVTGKRKAAQQAAELARRGIAYVYTGSRVRVARSVALAYELLPKRSTNGPDWSKVA